MKQRNIDVLNLEWVSYPSRDQQMATLVCNYLEYVGYKVISGSVFDGFYLIDKYNPKLFFITNAIGADINFELIKYAKKRGCYVVTLISEGNFKESAFEEFMWGWNKDKKLYEDVHIQWSERTRNMVLKYYPELKNRIKVSGCVGSDIYRVSKFKNKEEFLCKYDKSKYKKVIGIGCWDFGIFYPEDRRYSFYSQAYNLKEVSRFISDGRQFNCIIRELIEKKKDTLFLLKEHPAVLLGRYASAIESCEIYENVLILKNEESISDCINISDFWLTYESTTALESWLLNKQTCLLNPSGPDFPRDELYKGSPVYKTTNELSDVIDTFYRTGNIMGFEELKEQRQALIKEIIQWDDGLNHVRAGNEIRNILDYQKDFKLIHPSTRDLCRSLKDHIIWLFCFYFKFIKAFNLIYNHKKDFSLNRLKSFRKIKAQEQIEYYQCLKLSKNDLKNIRCK